MRFGVKADLLRCLESNLLENNSAPVAQAIIIDGEAVVQMLNPGTSRTFQEYGGKVFAPYIFAQLEKSIRIDLGYGVYLPASLKASIGQEKGKGTRKRVAPSILLPESWKDFLRFNENKTELFDFMSCEAVYLPLPQGKELYNMQQMEVEYSAVLLSHTWQALSHGCKRVSIRIVGTDAVELAVASFSKTAPDAGDRFWFQIKLSVQGFS